MEYNLINLNNITVEYKIKEYKNGEIIYFEDEKINNVGIILNGQISIKSNTIDGYEYEIQRMNKNNIFGDSLIFESNNNIPGFIEATTDTSIIFIKNSYFIRLLEESHEFLKNYMIYSSIRNSMSQYKIKLLSQPSIRERILFFIKDEIKKQKTNTIRLNMNKEKLALLLGLNRPSLSRELMRMKKDKLIDYDKLTITYLG